MASKPKPPFSRQNNATMEKQITQPLNQSSRDRLSSTPAAGADVDIDFDIPPSPQTLNDVDLHVTGAPPQQPFTQKQNNPSPAPTDNDTSRRSLPGGPGTANPSQGPQPPQVRLTWHEPEPVSTPVSADNASDRSHLIDHDYTRQQPTALRDHDYFQPSPEPPPGFSYPPQYGRPKRTIKTPTKYQDYDLS